MAATDEELISSYLNLPALEGQTDAFLGQIKRLNDAYDQLSTKSVGLGGLSNSKELTAQIKELQGELSRLQKAKDQVLATDLKAAKVAAELEKASLLEAKAALEKAKANAVVTKSIIDQNKELDRQIALEDKAASSKKPADDPTNADIPFTHNLDALEAERAATQQTGSVVNDLEKAHVAESLAAIEAAEAEKLAASSKTQGAKATKLSADELEREKKILIEEKLLQAQRDKDLKNQVASENSVKGSLEQRRLALIRLQGVYDKLAPSERDSAYGQRLQSVISGVTTQVKTLEEATGRAQRNVGNYGNAITDAAGKAFGALRKIAYILPGVGLAGLIGFLVDPIVKFVSSLGSAKNALEEQNEVVEAVKDKFAEAGATVQKLTVDVDLAKQGFIDKNTVVKEYNETMGKAAGQVETLDQVEKKLIEAGPAYIKFMFLKAAASEAFSRASKEAVDAELQNAKDLQRISKINKPGEKDEDGLGAFIASGEDNLRKAEKKAGDDRAKTLNDIAAKFETEAAQIAQKFNFNFDSDGAAEKSLTKRKTFLSKESEELQKYYIDLEKQLSNAVELGAAQRIAFRKKEFDDELALAIKERNGKLAAEKAKLDDVVSNPKSDKNALLNAQEEFAANSSTINDAFNKHQKVEALKLQSDLKTIEDSGRAKRLADDKADNDLAISQLKAGLEAKHKAQLDAIDQENQIAQSRNAEAKDIRLKDLENEIAAEQKRRGGLSVDQEQEFAHKKLKIEADALRDSLQNNIIYTERLLAIRKADTEDPNKKKDIAKIEADLSNLRLKLKTNETSVVIDENKKQKESYQDLYNTIQDVAKGASDVIGVIGGLLNASITSQKNSLQEQSDAIDANAKKEIDAINATAASQQDKAAQIAIINARADAQKTEIDRKQRQADQQNAQFQKAANIANIIATTALAVVHQLATGDPYTAFARAIAVGLLGAAQLAVAVATPIPKYRTGTKTKEGHAGGPAIVGDGGKSELVVLPGGKLFATPATDTVMNLPKGTQIYPDIDNLPGYLMSMSVKAPREMPQQVQMSKEDYAKVMRNEFSRMINAYKNKPERGTHIKDGELREFIRRDNDFVEYINRSI